MHTPQVALVSLTILLAAAPALAGTPVPVNPVFNGGFDAYVPGGAVLLPGTPVDRTWGVGHQVLGCGHAAALVWETGCDGKPRDRQATLVALASNPNDEIAYWAKDGGDRGDLASVSPARQNAFHAANWNQHPWGSVAFRDVDNNLEREAVIQTSDSFLYQTGIVASTHSAVPAGTVASVTFALDKAPTGNLQLVLDSFPLESAADWPQMFYNHILVVPSTAWTWEDGVVTVDPLTGTLHGPYPGAYLLANLDDHPTSADWTAADRDERRAMLMEFRIIQFSFSALPQGAVLDDVAMNLEA